MPVDPFFVSVIVPVYSGERFFAEAIGSIQRQAYQHLQIIVVDDGSTDGTAATAKTLGGDVDYIYQPNAGPAAARNTGLRLARGNIVSFLDADDQWPEDKLHIQLALLAENPSADIVLGQVQMMILAGETSGEAVFEKWMEPRPGINLGSGVFRKSAFDELGYFDEAHLHADDVDWFLRAKERGVQIITHREVALVYRRHEHNLTNRREVGQPYLLGALKKSLDRRRQENDGGIAPLPGWSDFLR